MGQIIQLDPKLQNLIAAGEVVERIGNVVKELVENSLDAKSSQIDIHLEESGLKKILVVDNGTGMDKEDAVLAFNRHATSKIHSEYDLFHISSLGFRGEALPSIGAISRVQLSTSTGEKEGVEVIYQDGLLLSVSPASPRKGTSIQVTRLFYQTPARFKYLKSLPSELGFIQGLIGRFALCYPFVAFSLHHDGKLLFQSDGQGDPLSVIQKLYGHRTARNMQFFKSENRDYKIEGYFANPIDYRSSRNYLTILVNKRPIISPKLSQAISDAFTAFIPTGKYPICVLYITVDPQLIDVNVHPTKQEIKFSEVNSLSELVTKTIKSGISPLFRIPDIERRSPDDSAPRPITPSTILAEEPSLFNVTDSEKEASSDMLKPETLKLPSLAYIGQYHGTYLLMQSMDGLYLMDQHAAAERIRYEQYLQRMSEPMTANYQLLIPLELEVSRESIADLDDVSLRKLSELGIEVSSKSESILQIHSLPSWISQGEELLITESAIAMMVEQKSAPLSSLRNELAKLLSCKHSLKANRYVDSAMAESLVIELNKCQDPYICPHGRPTIIHFQQSEIEKWFKRIP
ncbi:MAG: DNA mismatch repair endonuclease MutL [Candidatus Izemoplasmatales bacterium]|nr:DNA mismatch repair endonuclease MutL [Candidatus Izemoplasmatales bacterium]